MSTTLRDQLLGLGFKPAVAKSQPHSKPPKFPKKPDNARTARQTAHTASAPQIKNKPVASNPSAKHGEKQRANQNKTLPKTKVARTAEEIDLAKAYAIRAQKEQQERIEAEKQQQVQAQQRRQAQAALAALIKDKTLNDPDADIARHFPYGGKIKRVYVTAEQLKALNAGELGVLQHKGRYLLVDIPTLLEAEKLFAPAVALKIDPNTPAEDDPYSDPKYQVPDDLVW